MADLAQFHFDVYRAVLRLYGTGPAVAEEHRDNAGEIPNSRGLVPQEAVIQEQEEMKR